MIAFIQMMLKLPNLFLHLRKQMMELVLALLFCLIAQSSG